MTDSLFERVHGFGPPGLVCESSWVIGWVETSLTFEQEEGMLAGKEAREGGRA